VTTAFAQPAGDSSTNEALQSNDLKSNSQVDDLIEKSLQAYGNKEHLISFANDAQFVGSISSQDDAWTKHAYKHVRKSPAWRTDIENDPFASNNSINTEQTQSRINMFSTIYDGANFFQVGDQPISNPVARSNQFQTPIAQSASNSKTKSLSPEEAQWESDQAEHQPYLLAYWRNPAYQFQLLGETSYKHIPVYAVEMTHKNSTPTIIYLDRSNYLVNAIAFQSWRLAENSDELKKVTVIKEYAENRPALNSIWPFKETVFVDKKPISVIELSAISSAAGFSPDYFSPVSAPEATDSVTKTRLSAPIEVPFEYCQSEIVCRGKIENIEPLWFLIDTGTSGTIIDRGVAAQCLLPRNGDFRFSSFAGNLPAQATRLDRLELGSLIINSIDAQIADLTPQSKQVGRPIAGIIGMNVLANYLLTIDYARPRLLFSDPYTGSRSPDLVTVPFVNASLSHTSSSPPVAGKTPPVPKIKITLPNGDTQSMLIDTGAAFNHLAAAIAIKHLKEDGDKGGHTHTIEGTGLDGRPVELGQITLDPILIGSYKIHRITFTYPASSSDSKSTNNNLLSDTLAVSGILGNPFFEHFLLTIDCPFQRIMLKANPQFETSFQLEEALNLGDTELFTKRDFRQAEFAYQKALSLANNSHNTIFQALAQGRLGNLRRLMAHDLHRPEHAQAAYQYFKTADRIATDGNLKEAQGRILADWSLLYSENGQTLESKQTIEKALQFAPKDPFVNVDYAVHLFREHSYAEAEKYIGKALFFDPSNWQALWYQIKLSEMFHDLAKEKSTLKEIVRYYPWSKLAQSKLKAIESPANTQPLPLKQQ